MDADRAHVEQLEQRLRGGIMSRCDHVQLNGPLDYSQRYPGNVNLSFAYVEGESLLMGLREIAVSSGSACTSASLEPSYVLRCAAFDLCAGFEQHTLFDHPPDTLRQQAQCSIPTMQHTGYVPCVRTAAVFLTVSGELCAIVTLR